MLELAPSQTPLIGEVRDQSSLHGLLARLADRGRFTLVARAEI